MLFSRFAPLLALLFSGSILAQAVPATDPVPRVQFPVRVVGNVSTVGTGAVDAANAAKYAFAVASNGSVYATTGSDIPTPGGRSVPVTVAGSIPRASVAAAVGRFMGKAVPVLSVGVGLYELARELGFTTTSSNGSISVAMDVDTSIRSVTCQAGSITGTVGALRANCGAALQTYWRANGYPSCTVTPSSAGGTNVVTTSTSCGANGFLNLVTALVSASTGSVPSTPEALVDAIAAKSSWPSSSALARTLVDTIKYGEVPQVVPDAVTGPATSPGGQSVTVNPTTGQTTTVTTTNNHTYSGPNVTTTTNITNVVTNTSTGDVISTSTTTETPALPDPVKACGLPGSPACKIEEAGTPAEVLADKYAKAATDYKSAVDANRATMSGTADKPFFSGWGVLFSAPAVVACSPVVLPGLGGSGASMGSINPCPVVDGVRYVMAYIWALGGLFFSMRMIKGVV